MTGRPLTVVVPAHNEETVIGQALSHLLADDGDVRVVVVANGCTDATVARAQDAGPRVSVIAVLEASKIHALNAATPDVFPVAYVDADVEVSGRTLAELAARLVEADGRHVASPAMRVLPSRSWAVRQYYRAWALTDYRTSGHIGSGVYMLTESGRARFGEFPDVIADDLFVQRLFDADERLTPTDLTFSVRAPGSLRALIHRNTRIAAGNRQLADVLPDLAPAASSGVRGLVRRVVRKPSAWVGFAIYCVVYATTHRRARALLRRQSTIAWNRDDTTRVQR